MAFLKTITAAGIMSAALSVGAHAADFDQPYGDDAASFGGIVGNVDGTFAKTDNDVADMKSWSLRGSVNAAVGGGFNLQADLSYGKHDFDLAGDGSALYGTLHGYYRPDETYAIGAFLHGSKSDLDALGGIDLLETRMAGLEAAWFGESATFYAQGGYGKTDIVGLDADHVMGRLGVRYFLTDNVRVDAEGTANQLSTDFGDIDMASAQALLNYRPDGLPVSVYGGYRKDWIERENAAKLDSQSILAGLRFHFGSNSLREEERTGPVWSANPALHAY